MEVLPVTKSAKPDNFLSHPFTIKVFDRDLKAMEELSKKTGLKVAQILRLAASVGLNTPALKQSLKILGDAV